MKKPQIFILMALMAMTVGSASAEQTALKVTLADGTSSTFILSQKPKVTFAREHMVISTPDATAEFKRADISDLTFTSDISSAIQIREADNSISYLGGIVAAPGKFIMVYDLSGRIVASAPDKLSTDFLPSGVYIIKAGRQSLKIKK